MEYGVIMAGGAGTRLWPLSRGDTPKQLLKIVRGKSLLQLSYERLRGLLPADRIFVCTGAAHREAILADLPELPAANLLGEPEGRDTANAVGFPAAVLLHRDKDAVMAVVTADHVIEPVADFQKSVRLAFDVVREQPSARVTFGIVPTHGHTGLGYIHRGEPLQVRGVDTGELGGAYRVLAFKEKPEKPVADRYVESGRYYWNAGMFVCAATRGLGEMDKLLPESAQGLRAIGEAYDTPRGPEVLREVYPGLKKISVDFGLMEPVAQGKGARLHLVAVEMPVQWLDVGSWPALAETLGNDEHDNAVECGACMLVDSDNNIVISIDPGHLVATIGVSDMIIVHARDITMVCPKDQAQRVKELVTKAKEKFGPQYG